MLTRTAGNEEETLAMAVAGCVERTLAMAVAMLGRITGKAACCCI